MSTELKSDGYKVWSRYNATRKDGSVLKLRFQDISWDKHKHEIIDFFIKYYVKDEAFHKSAGIFNSEEAKKEYKDSFILFYELNPPHASICCIDDDLQTNDILGMSLICEYKKGASDKDEDNLYDNLPIKIKELQNFLRILKETSSDKLSENYETYYEGRGISVRPDFRGLGIANEFMRLRKQICIDNNVQMSCAWMTSIGTQKVADKYNWKTFVKLSVEELSKKSGMAIEANASVLKLMYITKD